MSNKVCFEDKEFIEICAHGKMTLDLAKLPETMKKFKELIDPEDYETICTILRSAYKTAKKTLEARIASSENYYQMHIGEFEEMGGGNENRR